MRFTIPSIAPALRFARLTLFVLCVLCALLGGVAGQVTAESRPAPAPDAAATLPERFGSVVYASEGPAAAHLYIIANGHRSAISGASTAQTLQAQIETFRIGEWLIRTKRIELLLPEGFFGEKAKTSGADPRREQLDNQELQAALTQSTSFVNAELLLHRNYGIGLQQVEDRALYRQVRDLLRRSRFTSDAGRELDYLQKLRSAIILKRAPAVLAAAYRQERIPAPSAMLTIGLSHLDDLIAFLRAGEIKLDGLQTGVTSFPPQRTALELRKQQLSVVVIVPRALAKRPS